MKLQPIISSLACVVFALSFLSARPLQAEDAPIKHRLLLTEYTQGQTRFMELDADGKLVWEYKPPSLTVIFQILPNGNIVYAYGGSPTGVREMTSRGVDVFNYVSTSKQVLGCERLANGNTLLGEQGPPRGVEVNPKGEIVHVTPLHTSQEHFHTQVRNIHQLPNGNILAAHEGEGAVREVDPNGKVVWEYTGVTNTGDAQRLPNGNTLIACATQKRVIEVAPDKSIVWEFNEKDGPDLNLAWISSIQVLKNGNILMGNFIRGQEGKGFHAFEVTRDKKIVWKWGDHKLVKSLTMVLAIGE